MKKIVYIAHKISGDISGNLIKIGGIYRLLSLQNEVIPFAPYIATLSCMDDNIPEERAIGFTHNKALFERKVMGAMGIFSEVTSGISQEVEWCKEYGIEVIDYSEWMAKFFGSMSEGTRDD